MIAQTEWEIIDHLTTTYQSLYIFRGSDGSWWTATLMVTDDRPRREEGIAYDPEGRGHVFPDGGNLQVVADGKTRYVVLESLVDLLSRADAILAASPEGEVVS